MRYRWILGLVLLLVVSILATSPRASRAAPLAYTLTWWTVDGGGGRSSSVGDTYTLVGTIGQADAGALSGAYTLAGGFWPVGITHKVYLPLVLRNL